MADTAFDKSGEMHVASLEWRLRVPKVFNKVSQKYVTTLRSIQVSGYTLDRGSRDVRSERREGSSPAPLLCDVTFYPRLVTLMTRLTRHTVVSARESFIHLNFDGFIRHRPSIVCTFYAEGYLGW